MQCGTGPPPEPAEKSERCPEQTDWWAPRRRPGWLSPTPVPRSPAVGPGEESGSTLSVLPNCGGAAPPATAGRSCVQPSSLLGASGEEEVDGGDTLSGKLSGPIPSSLGSHSHSGADAAGRPARGPKDVTASQQGWGPSEAGLTLGLIRCRELGFLFVKGCTPSPDPRGHPRPSSNNHASPVEGGC